MKLNIGILEVHFLCTTWYVCLKTRVRLCMQVTISTKNDGRQHERMVSADT